MQFYEIEPDYIDYLCEHEPRLMHNKQSGQVNSRKYLGVLIQIDGMDYYAPLSSFKPKHEKMGNMPDMFKVGTYAVININQMFPAPKSQVKRVHFARIRNAKYKDLLVNEYEIIRMSQRTIERKAEKVYDHKLLNGNSTKLGKRCPDFKKLEDLCKAY